MFHVLRLFHEGVTQFHRITNKPTRVDWEREKLLSQPRAYLVTQISRYFVILVSNLNDKQTYQNYAIMRK